jgi:hypothetical protein
MNNNRIFFGTIMKCVNREDIPLFQCDLIIDDQPITSESFGYVNTEVEIFKERAILIKTNNGRYIDISNINNIDELLIPIGNKNKYKSFSLDSRIMINQPIHSGQLFVDEKTLEPYKSLSGSTPIKVLKSLNK